MKRALLVVMATAVVAGVTGCAASHPHAAARTTTPTPQVAIAADLPPSPATWPKYPHFSKHSCSGRPVPTGNRPGEQQYAPSYAPAPRAHPTPPAEIVRRFLARFGDRRYIHSITDQGAVILAPRVNDISNAARPTPAEILTHGIANWETALAFGALRDDFCAAGGPSLVGGDDLDALEQRFPNPSPAAFRRRVALVGELFGFRAVSLRLLRPEQIAPLLIVKTDRDRAAFARDVPRIMALLNPTSKAAETFEGFYLAVEDAKGPFVTTEQVLRGEVEGGQWAASENLYPFAHG